MARILAFDSWTEGSYHFQRFKSRLEARGHEISLLHLGSWGSDPKRPIEEVLGTMRARDISYYGSRSFSEILEMERPSAVVFLSVDTFAHRAFNRLCRHRGIPTLHLFHGLVRVQPMEKSRRHKVNLYSKIRFILPRIPKAIRLVWPAYIGALLRTRAGRGDWLRFVSDILDYGLARVRSDAAPDARATRCAVYAEADVPYALSRYRYRSKDIRAVGNPDLISFGLTGREIGSQVTSDAQTRPEIMYIDTGLALASVVFDDEDDFFVHLQLTRDRLRDQDRRLIVKLHPQWSQTGLVSRLANAGVEVVGNREFVRRLAGCAAAISEPSSAAMIPALMGLPLLLACYGKLRFQEYGEVLTTYPRAGRLVDLYSLNHLIREESKNPDSAAVAAWIRKNCGPVPPESMPDRVADIIEEMLELRISSSEAGANK